MKNLPNWDTNTALENENVALEPACCGALAKEKPFTGKGLDLVAVEPVFC
jgi:hypothetical protein